MPIASKTEIVDLMNCQLSECHDHWKMISQDVSIYSHGIVKDLMKVYPQESTILSQITTIPDVLKYVERYINDLQTKYEYAYTQNERDKIQCHISIYKHHKNRLHIVVAAGSLYSAIKCLTKTTHFLALSLVEPGQIHDDDLVRYFQ